jgi:hypothetical protein
VSHSTYIRSRHYCNHETGAGNSELCASYKQGIKDPLTFKKNVLTEWTVYDSVWQYFSTPSHKRLTERDKCELLLKHVAKDELNLCHTAAEGASEEGLNVQSGSAASVHLKNSTG